MTHPSSVPRPELRPELADLGAAWLDAEQALMEKVRADKGGSPYLSVTIDLMGWAVAEAIYYTDSKRVVFTGEGDPGPASAFRELAKAIREGKSDD